MRRLALHCSGEDATAANGRQPAEDLEPLAVGNVTSPDRLPWFAVALIAAFAAALAVLTSDPSITVCR